MSVEDPFHSRDEYVDPNLPGRMCSTVYTPADVNHLSSSTLPTSGGAESLNNVCVYTGKCS